MHLNTKSSLVCGVIELKKNTLLDITNTRPLNAKDELQLKAVVKGLNSPKRRQP